MKKTGIFLLLLAGIGFTQLSAQSATIQDLSISISDDPAIASDGTSILISGTVRSFFSFKDGHATFLIQGSGSAVDESGNSYRWSSQQTLVFANEEFKQSKTTARLFPEGGGKPLSFELITFATVSSGGQAGIQVFVQ